MQGAIQVLCFTFLDVGILQLFILIFRNLFFCFFVAAVLFLSSMKQIILFSSFSLFLSMLYVHNVLPTRWQISLYVS